MYARVATSIDRLGEQMFHVKHRGSSLSPAICQGAVRHLVRPTVAKRAVLACPVPEPQMRSSGIAMAEGHCAQAARRWPGMRTSQGASAVTPGNMLKQHDGDRGGNAPKTRHL